LRSGNAESQSTKKEARNSEGVARRFVKLQSSAGIAERFRRRLQLSLVNALAQWRKN